jgi:putative glycosyltransferase (TIGR04348 family)
MLIKIITPAKPGSLHGNRVTAMRWQAHLELMGHHVLVQEVWDGLDCDVLIALHALRSHACIVRYKDSNPNGFLILILTGTDLYRDLPLYQEVTKSLSTADEIVVLQDKALISVPKKFHAKVRVIHQSAPNSLATLRDHKTFNSVYSSATPLTITVIGHLRDEKDPFCTVQAVCELSKELPIKVIHLGQAMHESFELNVKQWMQREPRYIWLGEQSHEICMGWLAKSDLMVISSHMEGGAHVVTESISIGTPVIASLIDGNIGLLGDNYPGYYEPGNPKALGIEILKALQDPTYLLNLRTCIEKRRELTMAETEFKMIKELVDKRAKFNL